MKHRQMYMRYCKDYGCWLKAEGDYARAMDHGESFNLRLGKKLWVPCILRWAGQRLWYVEIEPYKVKLNLRINEIYEIES